MLSVHARAEEQNSWFLAAEGGLESGAKFSSFGDTGTAFLATVGWRFASDFAIEGELGHRVTYEPNFFVPNDIEIDQLSVMLNGAYVANIAQSLSLVMGIGIGLDRLTYNYPGGGPYLPFEHVDFKPAAQLKIGAEVALTDTIAATANYRTMRAFQNDFSDIDNSTFTVGLKLTF